MTHLHVERTIAASQQRVFEWLADPASLTAAPLVLKAVWAKGAKPGAGALREVTGVGMWFREEITAYDAPNSYSYLIVRSFPAFVHEGGTLSFTQTTTGGTHVDWDTRYTHPLRAGGKPFEMVSAPLLRMSFNAVLAGCAKALEGRH